MSNMSNIKKRRADDGLSQPPKKSKKRAKFQDEGLDSELGINTLFSRMDNQLLADHLAQKLSRFGAELSSIEVSDLTLSSSAIKDTTSWQEPRTTENLPDFVEFFTDKPESLTKAPKKNGAPHTLVVAGAGLRAADLVRALRKFCMKDVAVAKLFAKHMKVEEQATFLKGRKVGVGVGTPARLIDLIEEGSLSLDNLYRVIVDASHIDLKKRGIMDVKDTMMPLAKFLATEELQGRYTGQKKPISLLFY